MSFVKDKVCLITGATSGIGKETAIGLARQGAAIVFTAITEQEGRKARREIIERSGSENVAMFQCDLSSMDSIRRCCSIINGKYSRVHVLVNNAGVFETRKRLSDDNIEMTFAVNYLAPFLMTNLLLDTLRHSAPARIINVTSRAHKVANLDINDLVDPAEYRGLKAYANSKLALILFTKQLATQLVGTGITVNCLHPGRVRTSLISQLNPMLRMLLGLAMKGPAKGAETSVFLAMSPDLECVTGGYFMNKKQQTLPGKLDDAGLKEGLWRFSEGLVGCRCCPMENFLILRLVSHIDLILTEDDPI